MRRRTKECKGKSLATAIDGSLPHQRRAEGGAGVIVPGVNGGNGVFPHQGGAGRAAVAHLFGVLKQQVHIHRRPQALQRHGQSAQGGGVAVVTAFVSHAGFHAAIRRIDAVFNGQSIQLAAEGDARCVAAAAVHGVQPFSPVADLQVGVLPQKGHHALHGGALLMGQVGVPMDLVAQFGGKRQFSLRQAHHASSMPAMAAQRISAARLAARC